MFDISKYDQINPPARLLMGPGPINADPRVLRAMSAQLVGQYDPVMTGYMNETMALYREVFQTKNEQTFLVDGTSRAGIESVLVSAIRPGDPVLVTVAGRFGLLLCEIARRCGAELHVIEKPWGEVFTPEEVEEAIRKIRPRMLLTVHGDTSTTIAQPLEGLGEICHRYGVLFYTDATATLGGNTLKTDEWGLDAVTAGLQKCMAGSAGTSPVTLSPAFVDTCRRRQHVEEGVRDAHHVTGPDPVIGSNYFDICMLMDYWGPERLNHHTEATTALYGARECARILCQEGVDRAVARHRLHGDAMLAGITAMGLKPFGDIRHKMNNVLGVVIPEGIDGEKVRAMLNRYGVSCPVVTVPTGIDLTAFGPAQDNGEEKARMRAELGIPEGDTVLLSLGRLAAEKNHAQLVRLLAAQPEENRPWLVFVGDGPARPDLEALTKELKLTDRVRFAGMVKPDEVPRWYRVGDIFVSASQSETQGLTYFEGMACGLPVLCRADPCLDGVVENGFNGWQWKDEAEFASALNTIISDPALRGQLHRNALATAARYSAEHFAQQVLDVYQQAIALKQYESEHKSILSWV